MSGLKLSFYDRSLNRQKAKKVLLPTGKPVWCADGLLHCNPTINHRTVTKGKTLRILSGQSLLGADPVSDMLLEVV